MIQTFVIELLKFLRDKIPIAFSAGMVIYDMMANRIRALDVEIWKLKLDAKYKQNEVDNVKDFNGKSNSDVIDDAISSGGSSTAGKGTPDGSEDTEH